MTSTFSGVGKTPGVTSWRVEGFKPVLQGPEATGGHLHTGDAYLFLHTQKSSTGQLVHGIHFWCGEKASQDEVGAVAVLAVELDDALGGVPKQYRETQGAESDEFLKMFPKGLHYESGGVASGFTHVTEATRKTVLLHVKGRKAARVQEVPLSTKSLNGGDCFILDAGDKLFVWSGESAHRMEKAKALDVVRGLRDDRQGKPSMAFLEEADRTSADAREFFAALGADNPGSVEIATAESAPADESIKGGPFDAPRLFQVSSTTADSVPTMTEVKDTPFEQTHLHTNATALLVVGGVIYVWQGRGASSNERKASVKYAQMLINDQKLPQQTPVRLVKEGYEDPDLKRYFPNWVKQEFAAAAQKAKESKLAGKSMPEEVVDLLKPKACVEETLFDDGKGTARMWRVENRKLVDWPADKHGHFFAGDCYLVLYNYKDKQGPRSIIYIWQGRAASVDEITASAMLASNLDKEKCRGTASHIRVPQGREPRHFVKVVSQDGPMVVHKGGKVGAAELEQIESPRAGTRLFHVRGLGQECSAIQVDPKAGSLNSADCFVLLTGKKAYQWRGQGSIPEEKEAASSTMTRLTTTGTFQVAVVDEGKEAAAFWEALGGQADYPKFACDQGPPPAPRLFLISDKARAGVEELTSFSQDDLDQDDVFLLDAYYAVFLWVGKEASERETLRGTEIAQKYVQDVAQRDGRNRTIPITRVTPGAEPPVFTANFHGWDSTPGKVYVDPYAAKLAELKAEQDARAAAQAKVDADKTDTGLPAKLAALESRSPRESHTSATSSSTPLKTPPQSPGLSELQRLASQRSSGIAAKLAALEARSPRSSGDADVGSAQEQRTPPPVPQPRLTPVTSRTTSAARIPIPEPKVENELERAMAQKAAATAARLKAEEEKQRERDEAEAEASEAAAANGTSEMEASAARDEAPTSPPLPSPRTEVTKAAPTRYTPRPSPAFGTGISRTPTADREQKDTLSEFEKLAAKRSAALAAKLAELDGKPADSNGHVEKLDGAAEAEPVRLFSTAAFRSVKSPRGPGSQSSSKGPSGDGGSEEPELLKAPPTPVAPSSPPQVVPENLKHKPLQDFLPFAELQGMTIEDGIDPAQKQNYLSDSEFVEVFKMERAAFAKLPQWRQLNMKKDKKLF